MLEKLNGSDTHKVRETFLDWGIRLESRGKFGWLGNVGQLIMLNSSEVFLKRLVQTTTAKRTAARQMLSRAAALEKQMESQLERQQAEVPKFAAAVVSQFVVVATMISEGSSNDRVDRSARASSSRPLRARCQARTSSRGGLCG